MPEGENARPGQESASRSAFDLLAQGALRGNSQRAFSLYEQAWPELWARAQALLRVQGLAFDLREDCGQAALIRVWKFRNGYRGQTAWELAGWMKRIVHNEAARLEQRAQRDHHVARASGLFDQPQLEPEDRAGEPGQALETQAALRAMEQCLALLPAQQRAVVELLYDEHAASEREVAEQLELSKSYVNVLRQKALAQLARCLEGKGIDAWNPST